LSLRSLGALDRLKQSLKTRPTTTEIASSLSAEHHQGD
jgi:hypothetical protein